jgi:hypothetical protein
MSFIAGIVSLSEELLSESHKSSLLAALPKTTTAPFLFSRPQALLVQMDLGVHSECGFFEDEAGVAVLAGHPFFPHALIDDVPGGCRGASALHQRSAAARRDLASASDGNWAGALYRTQHGELTLLGDRLATRPLYWWSDGVVAVFASTLSLLEQLPFVTGEVDLVGLVERVLLGYSLADRTPYRGVRRLLAGEVVVLKGRTLERSHHWRWADLDESRDIASLPQITLDALRSAVERRRGGRRRALTLLTGGLDSRVLNLLLHEAGVDIQSFNFSPRGSQDAEFGRQFAEVIGTTHYEGRRGNSSALDLMVDAARGARENVEHEAEYGPVWLGTGGSVCAGWVYLTPSIVHAMRTGDALSAVREHLRDDASSFNRADLTTDAQRWLAGKIESAIIEELERYPATMDPARRLFLFMVENDQRRNLDAPFEDIMTHRQEVWTPLLDGSFLVHALSVPVDAGLGHGFYDRWFQLLPPVGRSVPWQTYPGHMPCPLPIPESLAYQWSAQRGARDTKGEIFSAWASLLLGRSFPHSFFRRPNLLLRACLDITGMRDESSSLKLVSSFNRYWSRAQFPTTPW